jgi:hypothetical protein
MYLAREQHDHSSIWVTGLRACGEHPQMPRKVIRTGLEPHQLGTPVEEMASPIEGVSDFASPPQDGLRVALAACLLGKAHGSRAPVPIVIAIRQWSLGPHASG